MARISSAESSLVVTSDKIAIRFAPWEFDLMRVAYAALMVVLQPAARPKKRTFMPGLSTAFGSLGFQAV